MKIKDKQAKSVVAMPFPKLMKAKSGAIVLFRRPQCGTVIEPGSSPSNTGQYYDDWYMDDFKDFHGTLRLSNKHAKVD